MSANEIGDRIIVAVCALANIGGIALLIVERFV
jgi:hypothetical protein